MRVFRYLFIFLLMVNHGGAKDVSVTVMDALSDLFVSTQGSNWVQLSKTGNKPILPPWNFTRSIVTGNDTTYLHNPCDEKWRGITCIGNNVTKIVLNNILLNGTLPDSIGLLSDLIELEVNGLSPYLNSARIVVTGTLPTSIGKLSKLRTLDLTSLRLRGSIPTELAELTCLRELTLMLMSNLCGSLPSELARLTQLTLLALRSVPLDTTPIPSFIYTLTNLATLSLQGININGTLSSDIGLLTSLKDMYISTRDNSHKDATLHGSIPSELGKLVAMRSISLDSNALSGTLPASLSALTQLTKLELTANRLTGSFPVWLTEMTTISYLSLENNDFSGRLPAVWPIITFRNTKGLLPLYYLTLEKNRFNGPIPTVFCDGYRDLMVFYIGRNNFSCYPDCLDAVPLQQKVEFMGPIDRMPPSCNNHTCSSLGLPSTAKQSSSGTRLNGYATISLFSNPCTTDGLAMQSVEKYGICTQLIDRATKKVVNSYRRYYVYPGVCGNLSYEIELQNFPPGDTACSDVHTAIITSKTYRLGICSPVVRDAVLGRVHTFLQAMYTFTFQALSANPNVSAVDTWPSLQLQGYLERVYLPAFTSSVSSIANTEGGCAARTLVAMRMYHLGHCLVFATKKQSSYLSSYYVQVAYRVGCSGTVSQPGSMVYQTFVSSSGGGVSYLAEHNCLDCCRGLGTPSKCKAPTDNRFNPSCSVPTDVFVARDGMDDAIATLEGPVDWFGNSDLVNEETGLSPWTPRVYVQGSCTSPPSFSAASGGFVMLSFYSSASIKNSTAAAVSADQCETSTLVGSEFIALDYCKQSSQGQGSAYSKVALVYPSILGSMDFDLLLYEYPNDPSCGGETLYHSAFKRRLSAPISSTTISPGAGSYWEEFSKLQSITNANCYELSAINIGGEIGLALAAHESTTGMRVGLTYMAAVPTHSPTQVACPAGNYLLSAATVCSPCPFGTFSVSSQSFACSACPPGRTTPTKGSTSPNQCLSPLPNFIIGAFGLVTVLILALTYVFLGRYQAISSSRLAVVMPQVQRFNTVLVNLENLESELHQSAAIARLARQVHRVLAGKSTPWTELLDSVRHYSKFAAFSLVCIIIVPICTIALFAVMLTTIFFYSLIVWKRLHTDLDMHISLEYADLVRVALQSILSRIFSSLPNWLLLAVRIMLYPIVWLFDSLSKVQLDLSAVNVTCAGSIAPLELLVNVIVLGTIIVFIQSDYQLFRQLVFQNLTSKFQGFSLTQEYRRYSSHGADPAYLKGGEDPKRSLGQKVVYYFWYIRMLIGILIVQMASVAINFRSILQFAMAFVETSSFVANNGAHEFSDACDAIKDVAFIDSSYANLASVIAWLSFFPAIYEIGKVVTSGHVVDNAADSASANLGDDIPPPISTPKPQHEKSLSDLDAVPKPAAVWTATSVYVGLFTAIAPDLWLARMTNSWSLTLAALISTSATQSRRWSFISLFNINPSKDDAESEKAPAPPIVDQELLPSFYDFLCLQVRESAPNAVRNLEYPLIVLFAVTCYGHVFTRIGRRVWVVVIRKYYKFFLAALGVWTEDLFRSHRVEEIIKRFTVPTMHVSSDGTCSEDITESNLAYSNCLSAIVSTRAIILQIVPRLTLVSIYAIATSGTPLWVARDSTLYSKVAPPIIFNPFERARISESVLNKDKQWLVLVRGVVIFFSHSRFIQYVIRFFMFILSIVILYQPDSDAVVFIAAGILLPSCFISSLSVVVYIGKALHVHDNFDRSKLKKRDDVIRALHAIGRAEEDIVDMLWQHPDTSDLEAYASLTENPLRCNVEMARLESAPQHRGAVPPLCKSSDRIPSHWVATSPLRPQRVDPVTSCSSDAENISINRASI